MNNVEFPDRFHERDREGNDKLKTVASTPRGWIGPLFGLVVFTILVAALGYGAWRHFSQGQQVIASSEKIRDFVPKVRVAAVRASDGTILVTLPATTSAFAEANINSRASGYIEKRYVDIGDRVKEAQPLARITAPEVEHQIAQGEATLAQNRSTVLQVQANLELARVTWARDKPLVEAGWTSSQQGSIDVQNFKSLEAALNVAKATVTAQESQLRVLNQQKIYQSVVAPFDGVITQRNVDVGSLVQADPVNATFMFTIVQSDVIRTQVFVPQDQAFGLKSRCRCRRACPRDSRSNLSRQSVSHCRCTAAGYKNAPHRDRCSEWRRSAVAGDLLYGRAPHPAQDAIFPRAC